MLSDTFAGIAPSSVPPFIAAQLVGAAIAVVLALGHYPFGLTPVGSTAPPS
jgi:glycerol uptake facilitator-like aquaporin